MQRKVKIIAAAAVAAAALGIGAGVAVAAGGDDNEAPISGDAVARATEVALEHTGGGHVTETEMDDEDSTYEVEVTLDDGSQVDVQLDQDFNVVGDEAEPSDQDDADDN